MKIKINTYGEFFNLYVKTPIRTPATIEITPRQYKMLEAIAKVRGWDIEIIKEKKEEEKPKTKFAKKKSEEETKDKGQD